MKVSMYWALATAALAIPSYCNAASYYLVTGQSSANTTVDSGHSDWWSPADLIASCTQNNCEPQVNPVDEFDISFAWSLAGGVFDIKANSPTADIVFTLIDATKNSVAATATVSAASVTSSYTSTDFFFAAPVAMIVGDQYYATLTSTTDTTGNAQYDIKGVQSINLNTSPSGTGASIEGSPTDPTPEPSSLCMMLGAVLVGVSVISRRARPRASEPQGRP